MIDKKGAYDLNTYQSSVMQIGKKDKLKKINQLASKITEIDTDTLTRLTVVYDGERLIEKWNIKIKIDIQDEGRTLKIFYYDK